MYGRIQGRRGVVKHPGNLPTYRTADMMTQRTLISFLSLVLSAMHLSLRPQQLLVCQKGGIIIVRFLTVTIMSRR